MDAAAHRTPLESLAVRLAPSMEEALKKNGFDPLFPIQVWCITIEFTVFKKRTAIQNAESGGLCFCELENFKCCSDLFD